MTTKYVCALRRFGRSLAASGRAAIIVAAAPMVLLPSIAAAQANGQLQIHFIRVGQGDAALIISPLGETMLIDSGPETASSCAGPTGIVAYLANIGVTRLDYHVASHYDADHIGCTDHVAARWPIQRVAYDRGTASAPTTQRYTQYTNSVSARRAMVTVGQQIVLDAGSSAPVVFYVAGVNGNGVSVSDENDRSVVLVLRFGWFDAEFGGHVPGDNLSGHRDLESLIASNIGQVELYKVHHHGSATSSNPGFMATIRPKVAVLSAGSPNPFDHPTQTALDSIRSVGAITYWTTDGDGAPPQPVWDVLANGPVRVAVSPGATTFAVTAAGATAQFATWEQPVAPPPAPTGLLAASGSPARFNLTWNASPGATSYNVNRRTGAGALLPLASSVTTNYVDTTVVVGTTYSYAVSAVNTGGESPNSNEVSITAAPRASKSDFDGDNKTDLTVYRPNDGGWYILPSSQNFAVGSAAYYQWGLSTDTPLKADFDGDGRSDLVVYRLSDGGWYIRYSSLGYALNQWAYFQWGLPTDIPLVADFDGDGRSDLVVYRPSDGGWYIRYSSLGYALNQSAYFQWGLPTDIPLVADFDGDGRSDLVVYRPSDGGWYIRYSSLAYDWNQWAHFQWGLASDKPLVADFDGDGRSDLVVYRPSDGGWYIRYSSLAYDWNQWAHFQWGLPTDIPLAADFDGDGRSDLAVYRPSDGGWYIRYSSRGYAWDQWAYLQWGLSTDIPLQP